MHSVLVIAKLHEKQLCADDSMHSVVISLKRMVKSISARWNDLVGENLASLILMRDMIKASKSDGYGFFVEKMFLE